MLVVIALMYSTRKAIHTEYLDRIPVIYESIQELWDIALHKTPDSETKARIQRMQSELKHFKVLLNLILIEMILQHTDNLS